jgi:hypothetical protein
MGQTDIACPDCGYDFPEQLAEVGVGLAFSRLAEVSLQVAAVLSLLISIASLFFAGWILLAMLINGDARAWLQCLACLVSCFFSFAHYVVFVRVQKPK